MVICSISIKSFTVQWLLYNRTKHVYVKQLTVLWNNSKVSCQYKIIRYSLCIMYLEIKITLSSLYVMILITIRSIDQKRRNWLRGLIYKVSFYRSTTSWLLIRWRLNGLKFIFWQFFYRLNVLIIKKKLLITIKIYK